MYSPIPELNLLKEFEDTVEDWYAPGFELRDFGDDDGGYPETADRLRTFALATRSGSTYAIWLLDDRTDLAAMPIVFLGMRAASTSWPATCGSSPHPCLRLDPLWRLGERRVLQQPCGGRGLRPLPRQREVP